MHPGAACVAQADPGPLLATPYTEPGAPRVARVRELGARAAPALFSDKRLQLPPQLS
ncbi:hypothetical protein [Streptomyces sp. NPDC090798]|uniref:hypothetical protein n=1 Tax=Streptomyces sp. NPDC090798 TaxID=3365968 RepID=UPI003804B949